MLDVLPDPSRPYALAGRLAVHLGREGAPGLPGALHLLVESTGARSAVLRRSGTGGELVAAAGGLLQALPLLRGGPRPSRSAVELPVSDACGRPLATLVVDGAPPATLPALRSACTVLSLVLAHPVGRDALAEDPLDVGALLADAEQDLSTLADALHDGPVQELVAARYAADAAVLTGDGAAVRQAVQTALVSLRRTMWQLRPRGSRGLVPALEALSRRLVETGLPPLSLELATEVDVLPPTAAVVAYRLVQALAATPGTDAPEHEPIVVRVAVEDVPGSRSVVVVSLTGGLALREPARWRRAAVALGGDLLVRPGRVRLTLPAVPPEPAVPPTTATPYLPALAPRGPGSLSPAGNAANAKATS